MKIAQYDQVVSNVRQYILVIKVSFIFFQGKKDCVKKLKIVSKCFRQSLSTEIVEALFQFAHMIAKEKKPHSVGKTLIEPCILKNPAGLLLEKTYSKKIEKISLWHRMIKTPIETLAKVLSVKFSKITSLTFNSIQSRETTNTE